jgi:hypothetical protein
MKIYIHCEGGLGNQLFQYALGRTLAIKTGAKLVLDPWEAWRKDSRPVVLDKFEIRARQITPLENIVCRLVDSQTLRPFASALRICAPGLLPQVVRRRVHGFDPAILEIRKSVYLDGWFQSELYFRDQAEVLRGELRLRGAPSAANQECLNQIAPVQSICVHVRRGDYVSDPHILKRIGICGLDYYRAAIDFVRQHVSSPVFFIFSDDPEWTRANLDVPEPRHFISHNCNVADWEDIRLMSACRHFIIANSTFSWWGAWLGAFAGKIVVAPKQWFAEPTISTKDIVPTSWIRL